MVSFLLQTRKSRYFVAPQLRCSLIFSLYARVKPNASFAVAWFPSSLQKSLLKVSLQKANKRVTTSVLFRAHTRNLSKYRSFRYSSAITGGTCRSLSPCDLGALLKSHLPSAFHPSLTDRTFPQIRTVSASLSVGRSLKTSCKCTLFLTAFYEYTRYVINVTQQILDVKHITCRKPLLSQKSPIGQPWDHLPDIGCRHNKPRYNRVKENK